MEPGLILMNTISSQPAVDPALVPQRTLYTGARMPAIGLGTFGSDHVTADEIAAAVQRRRRRGLPPLRLRQRLPQRGPDWLRSARAHQRRHPARGALDHQQALERQARRGRRHPRLPPVAGRPAARLSGHVPGPLALPEFPSAGVRRQFAQSRRPAVHPRKLHEDLAATGETGGPGPGAPHRHQQHDHPQAQAAAARRAHQTRRQRNGDAPALAADRTVRFRARQRHRAHRLQPDRLARPSRSATARRKTPWTSKTR